MKNNKYILRLAALVLAVLMCSCSHGGADSRCNPMPKKSRSATDIAPASSMSSTDDTQTAQNVAAFLSNQDEWSAADSMPESGISGTYGTGYYVFDIDLDGRRELLVQLGGVDGVLCRTRMYRIDGDKPVELKQDDAMTFSVEELTLWQDEDGNRFYLNNYTLPNDDGTFDEVWARLYFDNGVLKQERLFYTRSTYVDNPNVPFSVEHFIGNSTKAIPKESFDDRFNEFRSVLTQTSLHPLFIQSTDWALYTEKQKENALLAAYRAQ